MVGLAAFGTMNACSAPGARIAAERSVGWNRQLRLTPLSTADVLPRQGADGLPDGARHDRAPVRRRARPLGVRLKAGDWVEMTVLILIGLIPFAGARDPDRASPHARLDRPGDGRDDGASRAARRRLVPDHGRRDARRSPKALPSYWLVQASHVGLGGAGWGATRLGGRRGVERRRSARRGARLPARHPAGLRAAGFRGGLATA